MMQLDLHPSKYFLTIILFAHAAAMLIILSLPIAWWAMVLIAALLAASFVHMTKKHVSRRLPQAIISLWVESQNWILLTRSGEKLIATLLPDSTSSSLAVVLNFKLKNGKRQSVLVFCDSIDKNSFRQLRKYLKTGVR